MSLGITFALGAAIFWTVYSVLARKLSVKGEDPLAMGCLYPLCGGLICSVFFFLQPSVPITADGTVLFVTVLTMLCYAVFDCLQFFTYKHLEISYRTTLAQITPLITFIASVILLQEGVTFPHLLGVLLIVGGNLFALYKHQASAASTLGIRLVLISQAAVGLAYVGDKFASAHYPIWFYAALGYYIPWISVLIVASILRGRKLPGLIRREFQLASWRIPFLALFGVVGYYFLLKAFTTIDASVAASFAYTSTILTALAGVIILRERSNISKKIIGAVIVFLGAVLLS